MSHYWDVFYGSEKLRWGAWLAVQLALFVLILYSFAPFAPQLEAQRSDIARAFMRHWQNGEVEDAINLLSAQDPQFQALLNDATTWPITVKYDGPHFGELTVANGSTSFFAVGTEWRWLSGRWAVHSISLSPLEGGESTYLYVQDAYPSTGFFARIFFIISWFVLPATIIAWRQL